MKKTTRKVKMWAIVDKVSEVIETADYFSENECPASTRTDAEAIYRTLLDAKRMLIPANHKIVPITIEYPITSKKKNV